MASYPKDLISNHKNMTRVRVNFNKIKDSMLIMVVSSNKRIQCRRLIPAIYTHFANQIIINTTFNDKIAFSFELYRK